MSEQNVELMKQSVEAFNRADMAAVRRLMDPEIKFEHRIAQLEGDFTGADAVADWFEDLTQHFDRWKIECDDFRDLGDRVLGLGTVHAVGKGSGVEAEVPWTVLAEYRNGLVTHFTDYADRDKALEAAGLAE